MKDICTTCNTVTTIVNDHGECSKCNRIRTEPEREAALEIKRAAFQKKKSTLHEQELARRILARRRLLPFVSRFVPNYQAGWVHKDICQRLEKFSQDVRDGKSPRLMLFVPPRHGKSEIASIRFPAWHLGHNPRHEIMVCSYSASLSMGFSRKVREMLRDKSYHHVFKDTKLNPDSQSVESWLTTEGGGYMAAGVGGAITGKGAHILLIDDPIKNFEEADSAVTRESIWNWWTTTAYTRLAPGGGVLVIQTRWHQDDLSGRLVTQMEDAISAGEAHYDDWEIIRYPAIADNDEPYRKEGEALHSDRYPLEALLRIKASVNPRDWAALYQQTPTLDEGAYFRRDFFKYWGEGETDKQKPELLTIYQTWDLALGKKEANDFTAAITFGVDVDENIFILDLKHARWDAMEIVENMIDWYELWSPVATGIERTHMQMAIGPFLNKRIRERKAYGMYIHEQLPGRRDKELRARSMQGRLAQGKVYFPRSAPWLHKFELELLQFPAGAHDDMVDVFGYAGLLLDELIAPSIQIPPKKPSWRDNLERFVRSGPNSRSAMSA